MGNQKPGKEVKAVHVSPIPTNYFTPSEFAKIIDGTHNYGELRGGRDFEHRSLRLRALISSCAGRAVYPRCRDSGTTSAASAFKKLDPVPQFKATA